jgi:hypothetical protein
MDTSNQTFPRIPIRYIGDHSHKNQVSRSVVNQKSVTVEDKNQERAVEDILEGKTVWSSQNGVSPRQSLIVSYCN